jgi:hypothetical protein
MAGYPRRDRDQEVLRDQFAASQQRDEPDGEHRGGQGSSYAKIPNLGKNKPESQKEANRAHAKLRAPGERANAQLKNCVSSAATLLPDARGNSLKPSTLCRSARLKQDK